MLADKNLDLPCFKNNYYENMTNQAKNGFMNKAEFYLDKAIQAK